MKFCKKLILKYLIIVSSIVFLGNTSFAREKTKQDKKINPGEFAPSIHAKTVSGSYFFLGDNTGSTASEDNKKSIVFIFFKTSSEKSMRLIQNLIKENKEDIKTEIFLINVGEKKSNISRTLTKHNIDLPVLMDPHKFISKKRYNITEIPAILGISKTRKVLCIEENISENLDWEKLFNRISQGQKIKSLKKGNEFQNPKIDIKGKIGYE